MQQFLGLLAAYLLVVMALTGLSNDLHAQKTARYKNETQIVDSNEVRILSWNIKMLPRLVLRVRYGPLKRARLIPQQVIDDEIDIIVFQEAFDVRARRILKRKLKKEYPYKIGPANNRFFSLKTNSGILIYSRIPIKELGTVNFSECDGEDCLARKGALLVEAEKNGQRFQVLGTHLEAGGTTEMKRGQYGEIKGLIEAHQEEGVPQLLTGDFNTHRYRKPDLYQSMLDSLQAEDGEFESELQYTSDELLNDMNKPGRETNRSVIDYILYKGNGAAPQMIERYVRQYEQRWSKAYKDLSDHNAVLMRIIF